MVFGTVEHTAVGIQPQHMTRILALLVVCSFAANLHAQAKDPLAELAGTSMQQWSTIGTKSAPTGACTAGEAYYTFKLKPAQVVVQKCASGAWTSNTDAITNWTAGGKSGIAFGGAKYEVKSLPASAPACKGNANCVRLVTMPDGKTDATRTIYLAH